VLAYSPTDHSGQAVLFADGRVEIVNHQHLSELMSRDFSQLSLADNTAVRQLAEGPADHKSAGAINRVDGALAAKTPPATPPALAQPVSLVPSASNLARNSFRNTLVPGHATAVLASFELQQNGNAIRIVDADGSVYNGSLQPAIPAPTGPDLPQAQQRMPFATREDLQTAQKYLFRVTGLNQSLKQNVVFAGNLLAMAGAATNAGSGGDQFGPISQSLQTNQLPWSTSRIAGLAVVAETNSIQINAVPLAP
jgi:hypothetical protein